MSYPKWAEKFAAKVMDNFDDEVGGNGAVHEFRFYGKGEQSHDDYLFLFFPAFVEISGGPNDGRDIYKPMVVNIDGVRKCFTKIPREGGVIYFPSYGNWDGMARQSNEDWCNRRRLSFVGFVGKKRRSVSVYIYDEPLPNMVPNQILDWYEKRLRDRV